MKVSVPSFVLYVFLAIFYFTEVSGAQGCHWRVVDGEALVPFTLLPQTWHRCQRGRFGGGLSRERKLYGVRFIGFCKNASAYQLKVFFFSSHGFVSQDGRYLVVDLTKGCDPVNRLYYFDLAAVNNKIDGRLELQPLFDKFDAKYSVSWFAYFWKKLFVILIFSWFLHFLLNLRKWELIFCLLYF